MEEAADASKSVADWKYGGKKIGDSEEVLFMDSGVCQQCQGCTYEAAVEHEAALVDADNGGKVVGKFSLPVFQNIGGAGADQGSDDGPHQDGCQRFGVLLCTAAEPGGGLPGEQEADCHAEAIGTNGKGAN